MACVIDEGDCSIRYIALPATVRAMTVRDGDGHYNIYINTQLSAEQQQDALLHEMLGGLLRFVASLSAGKPGRQPPARRVNLDITADEKRK